MSESPRMPILTISDNQGQPQYRRIADALCQAILEGQITPGDRLPTRQALAQALGTSPVTVGRGYEWLQGRGLVEQKRRSGTRLRPDALTILRSSARSSTQSDVQGAARKGSNGFFSQIVVVIGEPDLTCVKRDQLEILMQILTGVSDVLGDCSGRYRYVRTFDQALLKDLPDDAAVLVWGKQPTGTYRSPKFPALLHALGERGIPVLGLWSHEQMTGIAQIQYTPYQAVKVACEHLLACGYRRLGYIGDMGNELAPKFFEFTNVLFKAGLDFQFAHVREVGLKPGDAYQAALELAGQDLPDAFFVDVDWKAMEVMAAFAHAGLNVPGDVAVVGFGNATDTRSFKPGLTTVGLPRREIGQEAGRQLLAWATKQTPLKSVFLDAHLVIRQTTVSAEIPTETTNTSAINPIPESVDSLI